VRGGYRQWRARAGLQPGNTLAQAPLVVGVDLGIGVASVEEREHDHLQEEDDGDQPEDKRGCPRYEPFGRKGQVFADEIRIAPDVGAGERAETEGQQRDEVGVVDRHEADGVRLDGAGFRQLTAQGGQRSGNGVCLAHVPLPPHVMEAVRDERQQCCRDEELRRAAGHLVEQGREPGEQGLGDGVHGLSISKRRSLDPMSGRAPGVGCLPDVWDPHA